jgi:tetraacyldisaccharide 4'-kinase
MLNRIKKKIIRIMISQGKGPFFSFELLLYFISMFYYGLAKFRTAIYERGIINSKQLPCKVISVGNITIGGTGKTPMTLYLAELVQRLGYDVAVISRGYKGELEKTGGVVSNGKTVLMGPEEAGDEPYMLACRLKNIPVIVGENRFEAGMQALRKFNPNVIVLDDAFQHLKLKRDLDLVLLDSNRPMGNSYLLPRGVLREPLSALLRADAFILTRSGCVSEEETKKSWSRLKQFLHSKPIIKTDHEPYAYVVKKEKYIPFEDTSKTSFLYDFEFLRGRRVLAFAGIARNDDFLHTIESFKADVIDFIGFEDHHRYSDNDLNKIFNLAQKSNAELLMTTEKDYARLASQIIWPNDLVVMGVQISVINDPKVLVDFVKTALT